MNSSRCDNVPLANNNNNNKNSHQNIQRLSMIFFLLVSCFASCRLDANLITPLFPCVYRVHISHRIRSSSKHDSNSIVLNVVAMRLHFGSDTILQIWQMMTSRFTEANRFFFFFPFFFFFLSTTFIDIVRLPSTTDVKSEASGSKNNTYLQSAVCTLAQGPTGNNSNNKNAIVCTATSVRQTNTIISMPLDGDTIATNGRFEASVNEFGARQPMR